MKENKKIKILVSFRAIPQSPNWATGDFVCEGFRALGHEVFPYGNYYQTKNRLNEKLLDEIGPVDLLLFMECNDADPIYWELSNIKTRKKAVWLFDIGMNPPFYRQLMEHFKFDHCFSANKNYLNVLSGCTSFLSYAADQRYFRSLDFPKKRDVVIVGSDRPGRRKLIDQLKKIGLRAEFISGVFREQYIDELAASYITIIDVAGGGQGMLPIRWAEAPAAGSYPIFCDQDAIYHVFQEQIYMENPIYMFSNETCSYLLSDKNILNKKRQWFQKYIAKKHMYKNRCIQILDTLFPNETYMDCPLPPETEWESYYE